MSSKLILNLSNSFKTSKQNKLPIVETKFSKKNLNIICVLLKEGLIRGYFLKSNHTICVLLKYVDDENITNFKNVSIVNQRAYCDKNFVKNNFMSFNCSIISTRKGILFHRDAQNYRLGGFPLLNFF
jgi:ribosomal protein S8